MKVRLYFCFYALLMAFASLFSGCSADDSTPSEAADEIRVNADIWQMMEGTRASFFTQGTLTSGSFTCAVYNQNSTTAYINPTTVNWVTSEWLFSDGKHYWPAEGSLDFFAYMPDADHLPSYITSRPNYTTARNPQFTCTGLRMEYDITQPAANQGSSLQEFVYALVTDQNKAGQGASGVTLNFQHPFTRIRMQLSASHPNIHINSITFKGLYNNGTFTYANTPQWATSGYSTNFVVTLDSDFNDNSSNPASLTQIGTDYIMIPQAWAGDIEVNATWIDWGESIAHTVTTSVPTTWQAGYSYTYTFTITETDLKVDATKYTEQW